MIGVDYYPEHWPEERWETDIKLMDEAGVDVVRLAEFAWVKMEPKKGEFNFQWLDRIINLLQQYDIEVILGTPTAAPPAWVIEEDNSILPVQEDGTRRGFGARRHYCPNHPEYKKHTRRIVKAMADHFKNNSQVIGWQIDNELSGRCYCEYCQTEFQDWLKEKYGNLDRLNEEWGTVFWSQTYNSWAEIPTPKSNTIMEAHNPGLHLDYYRFISDSWVNYQQFQIDILDSLIEDQWITHNCMFRGFNEIDYSDLGENLDFVSWDNYPIISGQPDPVAAAAAHDLARGIKGTGFWIMEEQSGPSGWGTAAATPHPEQIRLWSYQALGHGADSIVFFRWRTCRVGSEQYWHGILDHHGETGARYNKIKQFSQELNKINEDIIVDGVPASAAIVKDYNTAWAFEVQQNSTEMNYDQEINKYYKSLYELNVPTDLITPQENFQDYELLIIPNLYLVSDDLAARLEKFVSEGGTLVVSYRSGVKEFRNNKVVNEKLPGKLKNLVGAEVEEYTTLGGSIFEEPSFGREEEEVKLEFLSSELPQLNGEIKIWADKLNPIEAKVVAYYSNGRFGGAPAITENEFGAGNVIYVGTSLSMNLQRVLGNWIIDTASVSDVFDTPSGVEAAWRGEKEILYLLNHNETEVSFPIEDSFQELITEQKIEEEINLKPYGVKLLKPL